MCDDEISAILNIGDSETEAFWTWKGTLENRILIESI